jgi:Secretion system C-terminal sorting domain
MKRIIITAILFLGILQISYAQPTVKASIGIGSTANSMRIYLRPTISSAAAVFSTLQFNVALPNTISPAPTLTLVNQAFSGVTWIIDPAYDEDGRWNYNIYTASSPTLAVTANTEFSAMELAFTGGPGGTFANAAHITCLPDGGLVSGNAYFFCSGTLNSSGQDLFYARDGDVVFSNGDSYRFVTPGQTTERGTFTSFARYTPPIAVGLGTVPVTFSNFDAKCNDKGAAITWTTASESNSQKFEIQRSTNSIDWITIDAVAAAGNSTTAKSYQYLDLTGGAAFYRIRQVDIDGRFTYTLIKQTNCRAGQFDVVLYPVPAKDNLTVVIKSSQSVKTELQIMDMSGRTIRRVPTQINNGNNTVNLNISTIPSGQYMLVSSDPAIEINKKFTIIR